MARVLTLASVVSLLYAGTQAYVSRPDLKATPLTVTYLADGAELAEGYTFLAPIIAGPPGLMIYDNDEEPVYINDNPTANTQGSANFRRQVYEGKEYLVYWSGMFSIFLL
jgi:hypothetical protein